MHGSALRSRRLVVSGPATERRTLVRHSGGDSWDDDAPQGHVITLSEDVVFRVCVSSVCSLFSVTAVVRSATSAGFARRVL